MLRRHWRELTQVRYGSQHLYNLLRREGWLDNPEQEYRLYCLEGLNLCSRRPRRNRAAHRLARPPLGQLYQSWGMGFVADNLCDGRKIRALTIVDNFSRQCPSIHVSQSLKGADLVAVLQRLHQQLGVVPKRIQVDNGSEFISKALDRWAYDQHVPPDFSRPGKPTDNPHSEHWRQEHNSFRPHSSLPHRASACLLRYSQLAQ